MVCTPWKLRHFIKLTVYIAAHASKPLLLTFRCTRNEGHAKAKWPDRKIPVYFLFSWIIGCSIPSMAELCLFLTRSSSLSEDSRLNTLIVNAISSGCLPFVDNAMSFTTARRYAINDVFHPELFHRPYLGKKLNLKSGLTWVLASVGEKLTNFSRNSKDCLNFRDPGKWCSPQFCAAVVCQNSFGM